jgi:hypothetical protein
MVSLDEFLAENQSWSAGCASSFSDNYCIFLDDWIDFPLSASQAAIGAGTP